MDLRKFFKRKTTNEDCNNSSKKIGLQTHSSSPSPIPSTSSDLAHEDKSRQGTIAEMLPSVGQSEDIGNFVNASSIQDKQKYDLLKRPYKPSPDYDFKQDVELNKRPFIYKWFDQYDWLVYSKVLKGALCKYCVLFPPTLTHGSTLGAFVIRPFIKYKDFHMHSKNHSSSAWHKDSAIRAKNFIDVLSNKKPDILSLIDEGRKIFWKIGKKILPIIKTIVFCGTHDMPLRESNKNSGNFTDLLKFRIDAGDNTLESHLCNAAGNSKYTSHRIQNEIISLSGQKILTNIVEEANSYKYFSVMADETADISGHEQLSIGIRYVYEKNNKFTVKEEFLGFIKLEKLNADSIACSILEFLEKSGLNMDKLVGQGYDGCSTMAGQIHGVQKIIQDKYKKAFYFHCASHRLNLIINDIIVFFRESTLRRNLIPNIPLFCETRWTAKYKSLRVFAEHFNTIFKTLFDIKTGEIVMNSSTTKRAAQLWAAINSFTFVICLMVASKYSNILEPVANTLQGISINFVDVYYHINLITNTCEKHRLEVDMAFTETFANAFSTCETHNIELSKPRICERQTHRSNYESDSAKDYFKKSLFIPYLDHLIISLKTRFSQEHKIAFSLFNILPKNIKSLDIKSFAPKVGNLYNIENLESELNIWKEYVSQSQIDKSITIEDLIGHCTFFPAIKDSCMLLLTLPCTTCTIERSFSTLRRIKTWIRSTMGQDRLVGLALLSIHRKRVENISNFNNEILDQFCQSNRRLIFSLE
ncbi:unnamed protein product [Brassicogethes aeneus]|uniref:TTF-type domain-containing protein n=1 Tax=Brassicogethes aeneus TaxID=1431903 RepID=A0A9P0B861_BRAAE|nr:unnamed protein product [Brassicogethes aeneus]